MRKFIPALLAVVAILGIVAVADALIVTDSEKVSRFADEIIEAEPGERIDRIIARTEGAESIELIVNRDRARYSRGAASAIRRAFRPLGSDSVDVVQRTVNVEDQEALVAVRFEADGDYYNAEFHLSQVEGTWQLERLRIN
ncbi:MAG: hypothetical protein AAGF12_12125 [Myxococcota bacterium]